jgi:hypothetical protein
MSCEITAGIPLDCIEGMGGVRTVWVLGGTITSITVSGTDAITDITGTGTYFKFELPKDTASFTQTANISPVNGTIAYAQDVTMNFTKLNNDVRNVLKVLIKNRELNVVFLDNNGVYWMIGKVRGAQATASTAVTGTAPTDAAQFTVTLQGMETEPAYLLGDTLANSTTGITVE